MYDRLPRTVQWAAALFLLSGLAGLFNAIAMQAGAGWGEPWALPRALLRVLLSGLVAWSLLRRARWAWWLGLVWGLLGLVQGGLTVLVLEQGDLRWLPPSRAQLFLVTVLLALGGALALLLSPSARAAFRTRAA